MFERLSLLRKLVDWLRSKSTAIDNYCHYRHTLRTDFNKKPPLLIYQMSKVGSSTVYDSLQAAKINYHIYHIHYLSKDRHRKIEKLHRDRSQKLHDHIPISKALRLKVTRQRNRLPWKIITLVRDPIKRHISGCFQRANLFQPEFQDENGNWSTNKIKKYIEEDLSRFDERTNFDCNWFDQEIKSVFDVNIYDYPFPTEEGCQIIEHNNVKLLIFRLEDLDATFSRIIRQFLESDIMISLVHTNVSEDKEYAEIYRDVRKNINLPEECVRKIYNSKFVRHFYSDAAREVMAQQWIH